MQQELCQYHELPILQIKKWNGDHPVLKGCEKCKLFDYDPIEYQEKIAHQQQSVLKALVQNRELMNDKMKEIILYKQEQNFPIPQWMEQLEDLFKKTDDKIKLLESTLLVKIDDFINLEANLQKIQDETIRDIDQFKELLTSHADIITNIKKACDQMKNHIYFSRRK